MTAATGTERRASKGPRRATGSPVPDFVAPQLATLVTEPPRRGHWIYEVKHDGYRMLCRFRDGEVRLFTRAGNDWTARLPRLAQALQQLGLEQSWLDGEIVVPMGNGRSNFQALQNAFDFGRDVQIVYYVFDAPYLDGHDLRRLPVTERKRRLARVGFNITEGRVRLTEHVEGDGQRILDEACNLGLEGLIGKESSSPYLSGRTRTWIKLKCRARQDFVIGGYTAPKGSRHGFGALLIGSYDATGALRFAGKVGTGFDDALLTRLTERLSALRTDVPPFVNPPGEKAVTWVKPELVAEVTYSERTNEGTLRHPSFMGLREDIPAESVREEKPVAWTDIRKGLSGL